MRDEKGRGGEGGMWDGRKIYVGIRIYMYKFLYGGVCLLACKVGEYGWRALLCGGGRTAARGWDVLA